MTGEIGDERPLDTIRDAVRNDTYDEIVLSTLPAGLSRWLRMDLPHQVERAVDVPITHVIGVEEKEPTR